MDIVNRRPSKANKHKATRRLSRAVLTGGVLPSGKQKQQRG
eukprot:CAMPEP_0116863506 /NCGR_PEP_ID=MMETSP0418-20121206/24268_1 /TAXON_ID=1158023 /ORGANISM="Astrosyne radiata, Strain 13vi08-1A" /LENGTH=40 /DNA_ID= /DNA_START= /DNA_END= /DNA_ORIENTATION=